MNYKLQIINYKLQITNRGIIMEKDMKKDIILGAFWGLISVPVLSLINENDSELRKSLIRMVAFPAHASIKLGMSDKTQYITAPIIGATIDVGLSRLYGTYKNNK